MTDRDINVEPSGSDPMDAIVIDSGGGEDDTSQHGEGNREGGLLFMDDDESYEDDDESYEDDDSQLEEEGSMEFAVGANGDNESVYVGSSSSEDSVGDGDGGRDFNYKDDDSDGEGGGDNASNRPDAQYGVEEHLSPEEEAYQRAYRRHTQEWTYEDLLSSQLEYVSQFEHGGADVKDWLWHECRVGDSSLWRGKKVAVGKETIDGILKEHERLFKSPASEEEKRRIEKFFTSLPFCLPFDLGFGVLFGTNTHATCCFCPLARQNIQWRTQFLLDDTDLFPVCTESKRMTPNGLVAHLHSKDDPLHWGCLAYLSKLYANYYGGEIALEEGDALRRWKKQVEGINHKGLHILGEDKYRKAEGAEKVLIARYKKALEAKKKEKQEKLARAEEELNRKRTQLELLKKTSRDLHDQVTALNQLMVDCNIREEEHDVMELSDEAVEKYRTTMQELTGALKTYVTRGKTIVHVPQQKELSDLFEIWYQKKEKPFFGPSNKKLDASWMQKFFSDDDWEVQYGVLNERDRLKTRKRDKAVDEGGPTRQFFSDVWLQMTALAIKVENYAPLMLFDLTPEGLLPIVDSALDSYPRLTEEQKSKIWDQANAYYEAIGQILFCAVMRNNLIAPHVLPRIYRNILLLGVEPKDKEKYPVSQVFKHWAEVGYEYLKDHLEDTLDQFGIERSDEVSKEDKVRMAAQHLLVSDRSNALESLKRGFTGNGEFKLAEAVFREVPLEAITKIIFAKPDIKAQDVKDTLVPIYSKEGEWSSKQEHFYTKVLLQVIDEMEWKEEDDMQLTKEEQEKKKNKLSLFVYFCTGDRYLPYKSKGSGDGSVASTRNNPQSPIQVEFNLVEMQEGSLPVAHTCEKTLKLPGQAYGYCEESFEDGTCKKLFQAKLEMAMYSTEKQFSMQ